jgi:hypothetical protein
MKVTVSEGNTKLGKVLNVSLPPGSTCPADVPCASRCYALKAWRQYPNVRTCWGDNLEFYRAAPEGYFNSILEQVARRKPQLVRWHVSGDIPDAPYLEGMVDLAYALPSRKFLAFTKNYDLVCARAEYPGNLKIVLSAWPGWPLPAGALDRFPVAWIRSSENPDPRIPSTAHACPGGCDNCGLCWHLGSGDGVVFDEH